MEAFAIAIWIVSGVVAAPLFCFLLKKFILPWRRLSRKLFIAGVVSLALFGVGLLVVYSRGAVAARELAGPIFFPVYALLTLGSAPALACVLMLGTKNLARWWPLVAVLCWMLGVFSIFHQYNVAEALYGIDGQGGPYSGL